MQTQIANDLSTNKKIAKNCLDMIFNQKKPEQAVAQYISANYRQHNPEAPDGPDGVIAYASAYLKANPDLRLDFKRIIAEGEYVAVHSHLNPTLRRGPSNCRYLPSGGWQISRALGCNTACSAPT